MANFVGPSHHLYYDSMRRKLLWLCHLSERFGTIAGPQWPGTKDKLDLSYKKIFLRLNPATELLNALDDTPIDSFLSDLDEQLDHYAENFFALLPLHAKGSDLTGNWIELLEETSILCGRELAQEVRLTQKNLVLPRHTVRGLFEVFQSVLQGGDFQWKAMLMRRCTDRELEYELRDCPHRRHANADLECRLESMVYRGFVSALVPVARFERHSLPTYCLDRLDLPTKPPANRGVLRP
jgi:hypothetical protein